MRIFSALEYCDGVTHIGRKLLCPPETSDVLELYQELHACNQPNTRDTTQYGHPLLTEGCLREPAHQLSLLGDLLTQELILLHQALEALLHPGVIETNRPQLLHVALGPGTTTLTDLYPVEPELGLDAILRSYPVSYELPTASDDLPMVALLESGYPDTPEHALGQKMGQLAAVSPIGLDPVPILLGQQARGCDNTVGGTIAHESIVEPEAKIPRLIDHLNRISPIPIQ
jgi:hypothetical protein